MVCSTPLLEAVAQYQRLAPYPDQAARNAAIAAKFLRAYPPTPTGVQEWLAAENAAGISPKTIRNHKASLSKVCRHMVREGLLAANPCTDIDTPRIPERRPIYLPRNEANTAMAMAEKLGIACEVAAALYTGLRLSSLRMLQWGHVDLARRTITAPQKRQRLVTVPICKALLTRLDRQQQATGRYLYVFPARQPHLHADRLAYINAPRSRWAWLEAFKPIRDTLPTLQRLTPGQCGRCWHSLRHTFATNAVCNSVDLYTVSKWLGHRHVTTTQRYAHLKGGYDAAIEQATAGG
jgi:site-specific recombinase XerC